MNFTLIPLLIVALVLATTDSDVDTVEVILSGQHQIEDHRGALIVGDAEVTVPDGVEIPGPVYVIGGEFVLAGDVASDVFQLAGTVTVHSGAAVGDELRHIGGTQEVSAGAEIGRRTSIQINPAEGSPVAGLVSTVILTLLLAWVGARLTRKREHVLDNVSSALNRHPVVSITVGLLLALTAVALFVFMAFTLVLIPIAAIGVLAGLLTVGYGIIVWGHFVGGRLPIRQPGFATGLGVVLVMVSVRLVGLLPVVGGTIVIGILLTAVGAIAVTYYGVAPFQPATLPD
ncbi:MAG: hypothetical protein WAL25_09955 [Acidimicrobiia bacterium]